MFLSSMQPANIQHPDHHVWQEFYNARLNNNATIIANNNPNTNATMRLQLRTQDAIANANQRYAQWLVAQQPRQQP